MISTSDHPPRPRLALHARFLRWARGPTFARDIVFVLAFKLVLLMALKYAFFNHPQAENMNMPPADVARAILSVSVPTAPSVPSVQSVPSMQSATNPTQGDPHAH
ncbi:cytochrome oxidase putative small subunit CydP [Paraburkholderia sp. J12]|uniref:cytochrome oxidase putative small subunit CydP n=1 Tax=Paraburkholderia sp. J12 TaxID=2805432 RepID=UPI002ABE2391|nr:cytochrome oxidase putative small subunit CydP [Paraburkholderia sp. J12]